MERFINKYRIQSNRMPQWDYSGNGIYFITLVTQNRECNLGQIIKKQSQPPYIALSDFGTIVNNEWLKSFEIRNELFLDEYIIMPNHLHAIVVLDNSQINDSDGTDDTVGTHGTDDTDGVGGTHGTHGTDDTDGVGGTHGTHGTHGTDVETHGRASLRPPHQTKLFRKPKSISSFIAGFKSAINSKIDDYIDEFGLDIPKYNRYNHFFQPNYHDHIIRNDTEHIRIKNYIINNPLKWRDDKFNSSNKNIVE